MSQQSDPNAATLPDGRAAVAARISELEQDLARARANPMAIVCDLLIYRVLGAMSRLGAPFPQKMTDRWKRSSLRRAPFRSLPGSEQASGELGLSSSSYRAQSMPGMRPFDPARKTVLVVSHDSSRTGAPIVAFNLAEILAESFNVVILTLRGGEILANFVETAVEVLLSGTPQKAKLPRESQIKALCQKYDFSFAIVNTAIASPVVPMLQACHVPCINLVHEFFADAKPIAAMQAADILVFSTQLTLDSALHHHAGPLTPRVLVIPQGKCRVPEARAVKGLDAEERVWLQDALKPQNPDDPGLIVIGAATVEYRKGVDLFLECANRVAQSPGGQRYRFYWFGEGLDDPRNAHYTRFVKDQVDRAGLAGRVRFLRATSQIELAYEMADALLLTSRQDPLPNVSIDALAAGLPVFCFDRASGIAEYLTKGGLGPTCVARYCDTQDLAQKLLALGEAGLNRDKLSGDCRAIATAHFNMKSYAKTLAALGSEIAARPPK